MTTKSTDTPPAQSTLAVLDPETTTAQSQPAPEAAAPPRGPIHTAVLPIALVALDIEVRENYLSADLQTICDVAGKTGAAVLIASAGQPLENREIAFSIWRKRGLQELLNACPELGTFLSSHPEQAEEFHAGTIDLLALDRLIAEALQEAGREKMERIAAQKQTLRAALAKNWHEPKEMGYAHYLVVRGDGEIKLCNHTTAGKEWGAAGNHGFYLMQIDLKGIRHFLPAE